MRPGQPQISGANTGIVSGASVSKLTKRYMQERPNFNERSRRKRRPTNPRMAKRGKIRVVSRKAPAIGGTGRKGEYLQVRKNTGLRDV